MNVTADLSIIPIGSGVSFSKFITECEHILQDKNLKIQVHAEGTNIEGDLETVLSAVQQCVESLHKSGVPRMVTHLQISSRTDKTQTLTDKVKSVEDKM